MEFLKTSEWHHWDFERTHPCMEAELFGNYYNKIWCQMSVILDPGDHFFFTQKLYLQETAPAGSGRVM